MARDPRKSIPAPAAYLRVLVKRFGTTSERRAELFRGVDLDAARLAEPGIEATLFTNIALVENLCRFVGEHWPLEALETFDNAMQGALEVAVRSAPTVGEGLEFMGRFGRVRGPHCMFRATRSNAGVRLLVAPAVAMSDAAWRSLSVTAMLSVASMLRAVLQGDTEDLLFDFQTASPAYAQRLRDALPGKVRFGRRVCAIGMPTALADRPSPFADAALLGTAVADLERATLRISTDDSVGLRVTELLRSRQGRLSANEAAQLLGMSRRTLVRRLAESSATFRALVDNSLRERASAMLNERRLSRAEMAEALGFSDPTSFSRACRRWFTKS